MKSIPDPDSVAWHVLDSAEVARLLRADPRQGLDAAEAAARLAHFGPNTMTARKGTPAWQRFLMQFNQPLVYIRLRLAA